MNNYESALAYYSNQEPLELDDRTAMLQALNTTFKGNPNLQKQLIKYAEQEGYTSKKTEKHIKKLQDEKQTKLLKQGKTTKEITKAKRAIRQRVNKQGTVNRRVTRGKNKGKLKRINVRQYVNQSKNAKKLKTGKYDIYINRRGVASIKSYRQIAHYRQMSSTAKTTPFVNAKRWLKE